MTTCTLQRSPTAFLLHLWSEDEVPRDKEHILMILLSLAKMEIAAKWKSAAEPSISSWFDRFWKAFILSKITDKVLKHTNPSYRSRLESDWFQVLEYMAEKHIISSKYTDKSLLTF